MAVTVENGVMAGPFTPNGVTTSFAFEFRALAKGDLTVYRGEVDDWDAVDPALYDVAINAIEGGAVQFTVAPAAGDPLYIVATPMFDQGTEYPGGEAPFTPKSLNAEFDRAAMRTAVVKERVDRALVVPRGEQPLPAELPGEGEVWGNVDGKMIGVPNGAAGFAQAVIEANAVIDGKVEQVEEAAETIDLQAEQVANNTGIAAAAAAQTQADAINTAAALALAMDFIVGERRFKEPLLEDAITAGLTVTTEGQTFAATGDDVIYTGVYKDVAGVAVELWKAPKLLLPGAAVPITISHNRTLTLADSLAVSPTNLVMLNMPLPAGMLGSITIPANADDPFPIDTTFEFMWLDGADIRLLAGSEDVTIIPLFASGNVVINEAGSIIRARQVEIDVWQVYAVRGNLGEQSPSAWDVPYLVHLVPELMRQETTGAAATTPVAVGDPVGTVQLIGSAGGYMVATADARRPTLQQDASLRYYLKFNGSAVAGQGNFMRIAGSTLNMQTLKYVIGFRAFSTGSAGNSGIVTFGTSATGTTNRNDGGMMGFNFNKANVTARFGDPAAGGVTQPNIAGIYDKRPVVFEYEQPGAGAMAAMRYERLLGNQNGALTGLTNMTGYILFGCQQGNNPDGAAQFSEIGLYSFGATDAALTIDQKNALRDYAVTRTRAAYPVYPSMPDITARNAARTLLNTELYGGGGALPTDTGTLAAEDRTTIGFSTVTGIANWQKMTLPGVYSAIAPRLITPTVTPNGRTVLCWIGHTFQLKDYGVPGVVLPPLLAAGYRVILLAPPGGPNDYTAGDPSVHDANEPALKIWTGAASIAMNTVEALFPGEDFYMHGISGGGWAATICQASDARIIGCTQFVGTFPDFIPLNRDWEQRLPGLTASYFDLYLLGASNGWHNHVSYTADTAGFNQAAFDIWGIDWEPSIAANATALGGSYEWNMRVFNAHAYDPTIYAQDFVSRLPA